MPSGTIQSGKGLQTKSQFRTIAPKIVSKVLTSRVLSGPSPSLSDQVNPGPPISSTPLGVPAQNYALMQVAGQKGTFSLVALPQVASIQPVQKPRLPLPENLKLPIPRYQPPRNNKGSTKSPISSFSERGCSKPPAQTQTSPSPPGCSEPLPQPSPSEPVLPPDQAPASVSPAALTSGGGPGDSRPPVTSDCGDANLPDTPTSSAPEEPSARQGFMKISGKEIFASKEPSSKPAAVASEKHKEQVDLAEGTVRLSTAIWGGSLQWVPSVPKGKLPILPPISMKTTEVYKSESDVNIVDFSLPGLRVHWDKTSTITEGFDAATKMANKVPGPQVSKQSLCKSAFCPATKLDLNHKTKLNGGATKRKGRKLKVPDEILSFQGKRRKCKRIKNDSQQSRDQKPGALKKYRSIMPKPVIVMPAVAPLGSPVAILPSQRPSSLGQDSLLNNSLTPKYLGCKQDDSPSPKPISAFRNGFSGIKKPWHRCPVCNHHFQFKQHLRDHMNTHTNRRPYSCRICRKAYVRPGSLSAHMKLHHSENRLKKLVCCEFCAKVFGHVRIYFGHLKEVHRVVISTEPSPSELQPGELPKNRDRDANVQRENKSSLDEDLLLNQADEVKLQIKCGRCQITAQSFAEIKFHLLYVHGEEIQGRLQEEISPGSQAAGEELAQHAAPSWKQHPERRKLPQHRPSDEEVHAVPTMTRQPYLHQQNDKEMLTKHEGAQLRPSKPGEVPQGPASPSPHSVLLQSPSGFNCILCTQTLRRKEELLLHWEQGHNCEDPPMLWRILHALSNRGVSELPSKTET
ncbi:Zinc finger protein 438 [Myotis brandtii]|uniref:Zinc finger protein 438 n=1 Tax=Myotis brandtii TaxID=109478 RepID=S7PT60_MYOBR|nr:PREDICTED: zinc finger protein 438 [Myotis brandtii]XP_005876602.1 PREDICTED: zinc finger protein 438 [Myotis brandtii]XP_005876603.1 PREDICTED: zinc finger protein 438 [Myotis brandtii]XP_005876604.1 PREDICTED: zinc finger protein 438 [Myotis brandtii]XP_014403483.1 PREDICTED: zinc finger protein 438 [Myotis brandtii]XP_014403484.1 PREDICTED: zinc finger protein 438 [Myotis brandtii]XP_014403485.1 PREDICTED: zinc finger protein 438 [Myotis brandtii]XP_014403486.1 PREDICTED: zinc finger p